MHKQLYSNPKLFETKYIIKDFDQMVICYNSKIGLLNSICLSQKFSF